MTKIEIAYFAAGQFYKPQLLFDQLHGVNQTTVGYMSTEEEEEYDIRAIKMGKTHFLDTVKVEFDADEIDFRTLLDFFWQTISLELVSSADTTYNTAIFCCDDLQHALARLSKLEHQQQFLAIIPTILANVHTFYPAASESQKYYASSGLFGTLTEEEERASRRKIKGLDQFNPAL